jgi:hypothetical protein
MMSDSADAWNRGDLPAFASYYEDSPQTTFMGREIVRGTQAIPERYRKSYPNRDAMGTLTFSDVVLIWFAPIIVRMLECSGEWFPSPHPCAARGKWGRCSWTREAPRNGGDSR